jgi:hypothetical protein
MNGRRDMGDPLCGFRGGSRRDVPALARILRLEWAPAGGLVGGERRGGDGGFEKERKSVYGVRAGRKGDGSGGNEMGRGREAGRVE